MAIGQNKEGNGMEIKPNIVVCPHCEKSFTHNRVNGIALLEIAQSVEAKKRMHCRLSLDTLEREYGGQLPKPVKKAILDGYNDLARDIHTILGFGVDAE
jgi:hypothetical protein